MTSVSTPPEMSNKRQKHKQQYLKMMRRPSVSELDESVFRVHKRNERTLHRENSSVDKLAKVQMTDHTKKQKDFTKGQIRKFSGGSIPALLKARRSLESSSTMDSRHIEMVQRKNSVSGSGGTRSSIPFYSTFHFSRPSLQNTPVPKPPERRHSVWVELSTPKDNDRTLAIRQKLYEEFNMEMRKPSHRPWSPSYFEGTNSSRRSSMADQDSGTTCSRRSSVANGEAAGSRRISVTFQDGSSSRRTSMANQDGSSRRTSMANQEGSNSRRPSMANQDGSNSRRTSMASQESADTQVRNMTNNEIGNIRRISMANQNPNGKKRVSLANEETGDNRRDSVMTNEAQEERAGLMRRMSAPPYLQPLSDKLSAEMEARLAYITGKAPRSSITTESLIETDSVNTGEQEESFNPFAYEDTFPMENNMQQEQTIPEEPNVMPQRKKSDTFENTSIVELGGSRQLQRRRKISDISMNRASTSILPPLVEQA